MSESKAAWLKSTDLYQKKVDQGYVPLRVLDDGTHVAANHDNGRCVFLDDDNLCEVHKHYGAECKPTVGLLFPISLVNTPGGYYASASFSCPAVLGGIGPPLKEQREQLVELIAREDDPAPQLMISDTIQLTQTSTISWERYLELEDTLSEAFEEDVSPTMFLRWAVLILENVKAFGEFQLESFEPKAQSALLGEALSMLPIFLRAAIGMIEEPKDLEAREGILECLEREEQVVSQKMGGVFPPLGYYPPRNQMARGVILRFLRSQIEGKRLLAGESVVSRLLAYGTGLTLIWYYLETQAQQQKVYRFSFDHLEVAFSEVEENILTHSNDLDVFFNYYEETLGRFLE